MIETLQDLMLNGVTFKACKENRYIYVTEDIMKGREYLVTQHPYRKRVRILYEGKHEATAVHYFHKGDDK